MIQKCHTLILLNHFYFKRTTMVNREIKIIKKRIKNMYLRIRPDKTIYVTAPFTVSDEEISLFIKRREDWISRTLSRIPEPAPYTYEDGELHTYLGKAMPLHIKQGNVERCIIQGDVICIILHSEQAGRETIFATAMKKELAKILSQYIQYWSPRMKISPSSFSIRKMRSRWGSCNYKTGRLHFSLDLISKPLPCIESVVVHELNHLLEPSHSPRFHALMSRWLPDYKERRALLNQAKKEFY